jgi:hypothetical protein
MMPFGDGTHSRGDRNTTHLTFTQKSKYGGESLITRFHTNQRSLKNDDVSSSLLKKRERVKKNYKKREKLKKKDKEKRK